MARLGPGLLALHLSILRIRRGIRHLNLGYDTGEFGELGVGSLAAIAAVRVSSADAGKTQCHQTGAKYDFHDLSPGFPVSLRGPLFLWMTR
jgi:hypothetical protein